MSTIIIEEAEIARGKEMQALNARINAGGDRLMLHLADRDIEAIWYAAKEPGRPLLVTMHGGGFLFGGSALDKNMWKSLRDAWDVNVASIGYRMTPEHRFPDALYDCYESILYLRDRMPELAFDREHISVMGNSAGANLAAATCLLAAQKGDLRLKNQILIYPLLDLYTAPEEKAPELVGDYAMDELFHKLYVDREAAKDPLVSPIYADTDALAKVPEAMIVVCEYDNLRGEGEAYAGKLTEAGVTTYLHLAKDMAHIFFENAFMMPRSDEATEEWELAERELIQKRTGEVMEFIASHYER